MRDDSVLTTVETDEFDSLVTLQVQLPDDRSAGAGNCPSLEFVFRLETTNGTRLTVSTVSLQQ